MSGLYMDLAPKYEPTEFVVPDSWNGEAPFVKANPGGDTIIYDWWKLFNDPILDQLEDQALENNADLQAAAERFLQARDIMLKARSRLIPNIGLGTSLSNNKQSEDALFRGVLDPIQDKNAGFGTFASWEPDFWASIRNDTWAKMNEAEAKAADYASARLSLQSELASDYFMLCGLDAKIETYDLSIQYYKQLVELVTKRFVGGVSPRIDVYRAEFLLNSTEAKRFELLSQRRIMENAIAVLVNVSPSNFQIPKKDQLATINFQLPKTLPSTLLERRPDISVAERRMAKANREIGIAKAAFFPNVSFGTKGGFEGSNLSLSNSFWSYGASASLPIFQGGFRRAQLQQAWSSYRETEDIYRSTVLNAFREVENNLTQSQYLYLQSKKLDIAVDMALKTQDMTSQLYTAGLSNSMEILYAQLSTLESKLNVVQVKTDLLTTTVALIRSLGGGWNQNLLPKGEDITPFEVFYETNPESIKSVHDVPNPNLDKKKLNNLVSPKEKAKVKENE